MIINTRNHPKRPINRIIDTFAPIFPTSRITRNRRYSIQTVANISICIRSNKFHMRPRTHHRIHQIQPWPQLSINLQQAPMPRQPCRFFPRISHAIYSWHHIPISPKNISPETATIRTRGRQFQSLIKLRNRPMFVPHALFQWLSHKTTVIKCSIKYRLPGFLLSAFVYLPPRWEIHKNNKIKAT